MLQYGDIDQMVTTTHNTVNKLLGYKNGPDALALYFRYIQQSKMQQNNQSLSLDTFMIEATGWGRDRLRNAKKILLDCGFIEVIKNRGDDGLFNGSYIKVYFVIDTVRWFDRKAVTPSDGETTTNTLVEKINTLEENINTLVEEEITTDDVEKIHMQQSKEVEELLMDFYDMRKKMKKPMTNRAKELLISKLERLSKGQDNAKALLLSNSIMNGWQGIFELRGNDLLVFDVSETPKKDVQLDISEKDKELFDELWNIYPQRNSMGYDECLKIFINSPHKEKYIEGAKLRVVQIYYGLQDVKYVSGLKRFIEEFHPRTDETMGAPCAEIRAIQISDDQPRKAQAKKVESIVGRDFMIRVMTLGKKHSGILIK